jgi:DNA-binding CsgD family transcriptional regulator
MQGLTTNEIAAKLYLSRFTVRDHTKAIYAKVGATSRAELMLLGSGLAPPRSGNAVTADPAAPRRAPT